MLRPKEFCSEFVTFRPLPYMCVESSATGGVLARGQVVWAGDARSAGHSVIRAYVDGVGMVTVDRRSLISGDVFRERAVSQDV